MSILTRTGIGLVFWCAAGLAAQGVVAGEQFSLDGAPERFHQADDVCGFYRSTAFGKGLDHFATEMLWACEAIEARRRAGMRLSTRLARAEERFEAYRRAVVQASVADLQVARSERRIRLGIDDAQRMALAESTGALAALDDIRTGF